MQVVAFEIIIGKNIIYPWWLAYPQAEQHVAVKCRYCTCP